MTGFAAVLVLLGCLSLAISQRRNWAMVTGGVLAPRPKLLARVFGWSLLLVALAVCIGAEGPGFATLLWPLYFAMASLIVAMTLSYRPGVLKPIASFYLKVSA